MQKPLVTSSPHLFHMDTTRGIMFDVILALIPATVAGTVIFGLRSLLVVGVCVLSAIVSEYLICKILKRNTTITDFSACLTGLLLALNLPVSIPLWMAALGSVIAIVVVKQFFGGLGQNFANPAITARIVLLVSFPSAMTTWSNPVLSTTVSSVDAVTSATPLAAQYGTYTLKQLAFGLHPGSLGETCAVLLLAGGLYLIVRKVISPAIPFSFIGTVAVFTFLFSLDGGVMSALNITAEAVLSGGLILGAFFMATDYVTSPSNFKARLIFGFGCGFITFIIRHFGALPEGVSYSILLMNIITPHLNNMFKPKPFGMEAAVNE